jgi:RimJ/RimL family protein N-acetyltransferase
MDVPELRTARLTLRGFREADFEDYAAMVADPDVTRFLGYGQPLARDEAWRQMATFAGHWLLRGYGVWAVEERATGRFVGRIGCWYPEGWPEPEIAYTLARPAWGHGFAREGAAAALRYARETLGLASVVSVIRPDNARSIRVATSLGAAPDGTAELFGATLLVYRYPAP